ncbi:MAG: hypothetical protein GY894_07220 [Planctomycetes bacterium]|nr:hypothetical protein [Planctomycetota bacterium]MCP4839134.1 hypothetical protein [Planctomycetota bacterium]
MSSIGFSLAVVLSGMIVGSAHAADPIEPEPDGHFTCTVIRPTGDRGAMVPDTWPGGVVPYEFDSGVSSTNQNRVRNAMDMLEVSAGVSFIPRTNESNRLNIGAFGGNWSQVGMSGGQQNLSIYNWTSPLIICHELIHALGRHHQQCRTDRDDYIQVNWNNIDDNYEYNYYTANTTEVGPYDFESVMHYSQWGFSIGGPTMTCLPGYEQWQNVMGQRDYLSGGDTATLQYMYPDGTSDASVLYVQASPDEIESGDEVHILSVLKNVGEQAAFDAVASVYLSVDAVLDASDTLLTEQEYAYLLPDELEYMSTDVVIPEATSDGSWHIGVHISGVGDADAANNTYFAAIHVGEIETCPSDISGDGEVNVDDILAVVAAFGACDSCDEDLDGDGIVGIDDLLVAIADWGSCP